jgi:hypothetical protein
MDMRKWNMGAIFNKTNSFNCQQRTDGKGLLKNLAHRQCAFGC